MNDESENSAANVAPDPESPIQPPAYHQALLDYLQTEQIDLWNWFSSHKARADSAESVRLELLKAAYRLDRGDAASVYQVADSVAKKMGLAAVTLYQAQHSEGLNASLAWLPDEAHVVLHGPVLEVLSNTEFAALLAHEFAHHELYTINDGVCLVMEHVLSAMISDQSADAVHDRTWRSHRLYTELHCDRRAAEVTGSIEDCVCALVKLETGLKEVSAEAYFAQAEEVLSNPTQQNKGSDGMTHPEVFIRARALQLWRDDPDSDSVDVALKRFVEGPLRLQELGLLRQREMRQLTREFLRCFLSTEWLQTDLMLGHAKRFFKDFAWAETTVAAAAADHVKEQLAECDEHLRNYFCYILLDFVTYDADLEEAPLAAAFVFAESAGLLDEFRMLAAAELKFGKRALQKVESDAVRILQEAASSFG